MVVVVVESAMPFVPVCEKKESQFLFALFGSLAATASAAYF